MQGPIISLFTHMYTHGEKDGRPQAQSLLEARIIDFKNLYKENKRIFLHYFLLPATDAGFPCMVRNKISFYNKLIFFLKERLI